MFSHLSLWYNSLIRIDGHPVFYKEWQLKGIRKVKHLKDCNNNFLTLPEVKTKYNLNVKPLAYYGIVSALNTLRKKCNLNSLPNNDPEHESLLTKLVKSSNASRFVYNKLITMKSSAPSQSQQKWLNDCNVRSNDNYQWDAAYLLASKCTKNVRHAYRISIQTPAQTNSNKRLSGKNWYKR